MSSDDLSIISINDNYLQENIKYFEDLPPFEDDSVQTESSINSGYSEMDLFEKEEDVEYELL